jgi:preprotein translocase subunit SecA
MCIRDRASITFQNYFRMYRRLSGMTGTADTEAYEFQEIYGLETVVIPTHRPMVRQDRNDLVYQTIDEKHEAIIQDIRACNEKNQPVLVGTTSIENSELLSDLLKKEGLVHEVLNAKQHAREADIVAQAGRLGAITIATNMAGRGTDIVLGGSIAKEVSQAESDESLSADQKKAKIAELKEQWQPLHDAVLKAGGLHILGTERHESRRIDNQLRGRAGRQGDAGSSRFFLSFDDQLLKIFAGDKMKSVMKAIKVKRGEAIESGLLSRSIETAQRKVEARNFDIRKQLLEYDDVANDQRKVVYSQRNSILESSNVTEGTTELRHGVFTELFRQYVPAGSVEEQWELETLEKVLAKDWAIDLPAREMIKGSTSLTDDDLLAELLKRSDQIVAEKLALVGDEGWQRFERAVVIQSMDQNWREHLAALDHLRQGIHLRGFAQKNPKQEYKREAFALFEHMNRSVRSDVTKRFMTVEIQTADQAQEVQEVATQSVDYSQMNYTHADFAQASASVGQDADPEAIALAMQNAGDTSASTSNEGGLGIGRLNTPESGQQPFERFGNKVGRNDPCPCGSGKKFKQCHGRIS